MPDIAVVITAAPSVVAASVDTSKNLAVDIFQAPVVAAVAAPGAVVEAAVAGAAPGVDGAVSLGMSLDVDLETSAGGFVDTRPVWEYESDDGTMYAVHLEADLAETGALNPAGGAVPLLPDDWEPRKVYGKNAAGVRVGVVVLSDDPLYVDNGILGFVVDGVAYSITGRVGERRPG